MMHDKAYTIRWVVRALVLVAVILVLWWLLFAEKDNYLEMGIDDGINVTPEQIQHIQTIGQWEFLSISNEELVDTVRKGLLKDDQLVRIYYGTLRLGVDMRKVKVSVRGDSVTVTLPAIGLLDQDFVDEARTKAFYESGKWSAREREALYRKARRQMLRHSLTPQNLQTARENGEMQFQQMFKAMGYKTVVVKSEE